MVNGKKCRACYSNSAYTFETEKDLICVGCKNSIKEELKKCEDWEIKRKEKLNNYLTNQKDTWNMSFGSGHTYFFNCQKCKDSDAFTEKQNSFGDIKNLNHTCSKDKQPAERENVLNYFKTHNIKSIKLENNKLVIEYNDSQTESKEIKDSVSQQIKSYAERLGVKQLSLSDLEQSSNGSNSPKSNKGIYIGLAGVGVLVVGIVAWLLVRNKNKEE